MARKHTFIDTLRRSTRITTVVTACLLMAAAIPMQLGGVVLAQENTFDTMKSKLTSAVDTRLGQSQEINETVENASYLPANLKQKIANDNKANTAALTSIKNELDGAKTPADLQKSATKLDGQYGQSQFNVQQAAIAQDLNTQKDAANQLQGMVDQAKALMQQCTNQHEATDHEHGEGESHDTSQCTTVSGNPSTGGSGSNINVQELITKIIAILAAIASIIASIVTLIVAIQNGDYTTAYQLFLTIIGQLEVVASMLQDGQSQMSQAVDGLGGSTSTGDGTGGGSNGGTAGGSTGGGTSNSANLLPVGDGKYTTSGAKKGYVYTCSQYAKNLQQGRGGAEKRGPWFVNNNTEYDPSKKLHVQGSVRWNGSFNNTVSGSTRTIRTNDVPGGHTTGKFPISSSDPAYSYDRNPNSINEQSITYSLPANPTYGNPQCIGHEVGVMLSGVIMFNALDERGRDAGAWETQDSCEGHPENNHKYHYHTLSGCIGNVDSKTVIGFALDGFPITGGQDSGKQLTTNDLDECHGMTSEIILDGKKTKTYHYVMTRDFPYSVSCYRSKAVPPSGMR